MKQNSITEWDECGRGECGKVDCTVYDFFPFVDGFQAVVSDGMPMVYLDRLAQVLEPAIDVLTDSIETGERGDGVVNALLYMVAAHARIELVRAFRQEILDVQDHAALLSEMAAEWEKYVDAEQFMFVPRSDVVSAVLDSAVATLWYDYSATTLATAADIVRKFSVSVSGLRLVSVGEFLVEAHKGTLIWDLVADDMSKPVLPRQVYKEVLACVQGLYKQPPASLVPRFVSDVADQLQLSCVTSRRAFDLIWMVLTTAKVVEGYCYQLLFEPSARASVCLALGSCPQVSDVLWMLDSCCQNWASVEATYKFYQGTCASDRPLVGSVVHVEHSGNPDLVFLEKNKMFAIGAPIVKAEPDYYARALIDEFISKHRALKPLPAPPPVDQQFEQLSIAPRAGGDRGFVDVSEKFYGMLGEPLSPRASSSTGMVTGLVSSDEYVTEVDTKRIRALNDRLSDGAAIHETYFEKSRSRFLRRMQRPALAASEGKCYHVFEGFPVDGGGSTDCWILDKSWDVPGWTSYVAYFNNQSTVVTFVAPDNATDVRMDCTGTGTIELGSCKISVDCSVLWFSRSIKMQVMTKARVALRISVPESGSSVAVGALMRRYMYLPGYTVVARSFDILSSAASVSIVIDKRGAVNSSGCQIHFGNKYIERGRHRFKLSGLISEAPVKMAIKTDPPDAFESITVCGMRLKPRMREYVTALYDARNSSLHISLIENALVSVSIVQVIDHAAFDVVAQSINNAGSVD